MSDDHRGLPASSRAHVTGYCVLRLQVRDLQRSVAFYRDVIGYACADPTGGPEALVEPNGGTGPGLFLMEASEREFRHIHWEQWGEFYTAFELFVDDVHALRHRLLEAGAETHEPAERGGYLTMGFFDPDGHFLFAVDRRGRYFSLRPRIEALLQRPMSELEANQFQCLCAATAGRDDLAVLMSMLSDVADR